MTASTSQKGLKANTYIWGPPRDPSDVISINFHVNAPAELCINRIRSTPR